jgi:hypothetical protein
MGDTIARCRALRAAGGHIQHVGAAVHLGALAQQVEKASRIAVRQAGHDAVGLVHMQAEFEPALQCCVHHRRQRDAVVRGQAPEVQVVLQHQVVVVGRELAVHAVSEQVGGDVGDRLFEREGAPVRGTRHLGEDDAGEEDRVELERAVVALGREVRAQVFDLFVDRLQHPRVERRIEARVGRGMSHEAAVAVDPVLHAPPGHVGGDEAGRRGLHPAADQLDPALRVAPVAAALERQREPDRVVELVQQDVPLDVGTRVVQPGDRVAQAMGLVVELEVAVQQRVDLLGPGFVGVGDHVVAHCARGAVVREQGRVVERTPRRQKDRSSRCVENLHRRFVQVHAVAF